MFRGLWFINYFTNIIKGFYSDALHVLLHHNKIHAYKKGKRLYMSIY